MEVMIIKLEKVLKLKVPFKIHCFQKCRSRDQKLVVLRNIFANYHILTLLISENFPIFF